MRKFIFTYGVPSYEDPSLKYFMETLIDVSRFMKSVSHDEAQKITFWDEKYVGW